MRRTQARRGSQFGPIECDPVLSEITCRRCPVVGATIVALGRDDNAAAEYAWCGPGCAILDGWPWLRSERDRAPVAEQADLFDGSAP